MNSSVDSVFAIDAATRTGWALLDIDGSICSGFKDFSKCEGHGAVFHGYGLWLKECLAELAPAVVAYEVPQIGLANRVSGNTSRLLLGGLYGVTNAHLTTSNLACVQISPADAKKAATGKGNAGKRDVLKAIREKGFDPANADEADAVAILIAAMGKLDIQSPHIVREAA